MFSLAQPADEEEGVGRYVAVRYVHLSPTDRVNK